MHIVGVSDAYILVNVYSCLNNSTVEFHLPGIAVSTITS